MRRTDLGNCSSSARPCRAGATRGLRASTKRNYEDALRPVRERPGTRPLQSITKSDVEDLVDWMLTAGRRRGGKPGTGLSGRSVRLTLGRFSAALEAAVLEGKLVRNVARESSASGGAYRLTERLLIFKRLLFRIIRPMRSASQGSVLAILPALGAVGRLASQSAVLRTGGGPSVVAASWRRCSSSSRPSWARCSARSSRLSRFTTFQIGTAIAMSEKCSTCRSS